MKIEGGYYIKARKLRNSDIAKKPPCYREIWDWLIEQANHSTNGAIPRGSCMRSIRDMQEGLSWYIGYRKGKYTKSQCENALKWLRREGMITTTKTTRGMFIKVDNYKDYQNPKNYESNNGNNNESNKTATTQPHYKQECKNVKNVKKEHSLFDFWNSLEIIVHKNIKGKAGNRTFKGCLEQALKDNNEETIREAMQNYKTILEGEEYFWKYRWTIGEFLIRGLDKFLTINKPFENFRIGKENQEKKEQNYDKLTARYSNR